MAKKRKKGGAEPAKDAKKAAAQPGKVESKSRIGDKPPGDGKKGHESEHTVGQSKSGTERPDSHTTERGESAMDGENKWVCKITNIEFFNIRTG